MTKSNPINDQLLADWWQMPLGQAVLTKEKAALSELSSHFHGYFQVQMGLNQMQLPETLKPSQQKIMAAQGDLIGEAENLPFKCHSLDLLLLNHVLEFSNDPHQVLREAERSLVADGTVVLCSFNPLSLWGAKRLLSLQDSPPWHGKFFHHSRIKDWLSLLNFEIIATKKLLFTPPLRSSTCLTKFGFMERWGQRLWSIFAGVIIIVATKRTLPVTPIKHRWQSRRLFSPNGFIQKPTARETLNE